MKMIDLTNNRFNRLLVLYKDNESVHGKIRWICQCNCGVIKSIAGSDLRNGDIQSCGCLSVEKHKLIFTTHGLSQSPEYRIYMAMIARCYNVNVPNFHRYGGRGITVCDRWLHSFENFYSDMGPKPSNDHSIDRRNNDGEYSPQNCYWATHIEQNNNKCNSRKIDFDGDKISLKELSAKTNIKVGTLASRYYKGVENIGDTLREHKMYEYCGQLATLGEWGRKYNISYKKLHQRIQRGWSLDRALNE
jgi:hypothetical protein